VKDGAGGEWRLWDGGLVANNPALVAVGEVARVSGQLRPDVRILSLGTGYQDALVRAGDWGQLNPRAARSIISVQLDASVGSTAFLMRQLFGNDALRVSVPIKPSEGFEMDDPSAVDRLLAKTDEYYDTKRGRVTQPDGTTEDLSVWLKTHW
jgi:hypothetical protein